MSTDTAERAPVRPLARLFELLPIDRTCIKRLVGHTLASIEREFILQTLAECRGNRTHSADILGISIRSLRDKIRRYRDEGRDIPEPQPTALDATAALAPAVWPTHDRPIIGLQPPFTEAQAPPEADQPYRQCR